MGFLKKYPYIFYFSLWYSNGSETAVYIFPGEETAPSIFVVFEESLPREALIKPLSDFILEFLCSARNGMTRIASYLRNSMTQQYIKILIKSDSAT